MPSSRGPSWTRNQTHISYVSCIGRQVLSTSATCETLGQSQNFKVCFLCSLGLVGFNMPWLSSERPKDQYPIGTNPSWESEPQMATFSSDPVTNWRSGEEAQAFTHRDRALGWLISSCKSLLNTTNSVPNFSGKPGDESSTHYLGNQF